MTKVFFLKDEDGVFAYFPEINYYGRGSRSNDTMRTCYAHIGQHSACSADYIDECEIATKEEYEALAKELQAIGYDLSISNENKL
jgi:hypothetical protein